jgi:hypothetical protein
MQDLPQVFALLAREEATVNDKPRIIHWRGYRIPATKEFRALCTARVLEEECTHLPRNITCVNCKAILIRQQRGGRK